jgi:very-short-patch-repair endonuclease
MILFNKHETLIKRKRLRKNQTKTEKILWKHLRRRGFSGLKFYRQYGIGPFITDFYCPKYKIAIEIDGCQHYTKRGLLYDANREKYMLRFGIKTIRFTNRDVLSKLECVLNAIRNEMVQRAVELSPSPLFRKERER